MLGPNPRRAGMSTASSTIPSPSSELPPKTAMTAQQSDGLMVKAIDEIFRHVEMNDEPSSFKVNDRVMCVWHTLTMIRVQSVLPFRDFDMRKKQFARTSIHVVRVPAACAI